jgi:2-methylcitrate dehydratase PrpD
VRDPHGLSSSLAAFVVNTDYTDLPQRTREITKRCLLDGIGVSLAASGMGEGCRAFLDLGAAQGGHPTCTVLGTGRKLPVEAAAFANGAMAHAMDYEDAHDGTLLHPNAAAIPASLAVAEAFGPVSGRDLIAALAVGCDVAVRLGLALRVSLSDLGWYPPPMLAAFGATAAAGKLLRLSAQQISDAFSLTLCQSVCSGEIKYSPDSVIRAVRDAFAARAAVSSALLAARGVTGFDAPFEGRAGFYAMYARGSYDATTILQDLGTRFEIENISFKPWPSCRGTHSAIEAALKLLDAHRFDVSDITAVALNGSRIMRMLNEPHATKRHPTTAIDAKFSLPFTTAAALVYGRVTLEEYSPAALADERVLALAERVSLEIDPSLAENDIGCRLRISTRSGAAYSIEVSTPLGSPQNPLSEARFIEKFVDCAGYAALPLGAARAAEVAGAAFELDSINDVTAQFMPLLQAE